MPGAELGTVLAVLRIVRGWNQEELAQASGLRSGTISDYERGKMVPGLNTLQRLLDAMGYPLAVLDQARAFIGSLRTGSLPPEQSLGPAGGPAALRREAEQVSVEAGRVVSRLTRLMLAVMSSPPSGEGDGGLRSGE